MRVVNHRDETIDYQPPEPLSTEQRQMLAEAKTLANSEELRAALKIILRLTWQYEHRVGAQECRAQRQVEESFEWNELMFGAFGAYFVDVTQSEYDEVRAEVAAELEAAK